MTLLKHSIKGMPSDDLTLVRGNLLHK